MATRLSSPTCKTVRLEPWPILWPRIRLRLPNVWQHLQSLRASSTSCQRARAYPVNFFLLNPFVAGRMNYVDDTGWHSYNGLQLQFRQRFSHGINWTANYTWSNSLTNLSADNQNQSLDFTTLRNTIDKRLSQFDIRHVIQTYGTYDLPVGRGRRLSIDNQFLEGVVGGWTVGSIFVFATGQPIQLTGGFQTVNNSNNPARNGVRLAPGVTLAQLSDVQSAAHSLNR